MMEKILYLEAVEVLPTRKMPKNIQAGGGYRLLLLNGDFRLVTKKDFIEKYEPVNESEKFRYHVLAMKGTNSAGEDLGSS